jgi:RNA polymerase sigma-70 factor, ECF subfamily
MAVEHLSNPDLDLPLDERLLLCRVAAGDRSALERLYYRYYHRLAGFLWRSIGRSDGVEEIVNDTFMEVWRDARHSRESSRIISTWVFGIAYRKALEYLEQRHNCAAGFDAQHSSRQFIGAVNDAEIGRGLWRRLKLLSFGERSTLILAYQVGCARQEIAAITSVPVGSVEARMLGAREKLRCSPLAAKERISHVSASDR